MCGLKETANYTLTADWSGLKLNQALTYCLIVLLYTKTYSVVFLSREQTKKIDVNL